MGGVLRLGVLLVGLHGATASTFVNHFLERHRQGGFEFGSYWPGLSNSDPLTEHEVVLGGWDFRYSSVAEAVQQNKVVPPELVSGELGTVETLHPVVGPNDYAHRVEDVGATNRALSDAISGVRDQLRNFKEVARLDRILVINLASPMASPSLKSKSWDGITAYSRATIEEGYDWVEFTPSDSIDSYLQERSKVTGSRLAGRDGSTGQTLLKLQLLQFLTARGLAINSWYSTNLIGNHDGKVLAHPDYNETKIRDKRSVLDGVVEPASHVVSIVFNGPSGDNKEAWDCVHFSGWMNTPMSFRVNWLGADSYLAGGLITDIVRYFITAHLRNDNFGIQLPLSLMFKNPIGYENTSFSERFELLTNYVNTSI